LPPVLCEAAGYTGGQRYVALWWTPLGDEMVLSDGTTTAGGWRPAWLALREHPLGQALLAPYRLGDSGTDAEHHLLADRWHSTLHVGLAVDVDQLLATSHPSSTRSSECSAPTALGS
jgi:hypothetical protein